ncbi:DNA polymerase III subunit gamma and tau [Brevibacterium sp.]|uniref:DNA polymerase III subunit gamma and tau n=1 Tax=Brevibacterium sp. TaxID=1701 RepID=UPI0028109D8D|nr:DNA polymerase III subunit gamma and tau [Brevibacterium sp.]
MSTALYRRYRPETFDEVIGQEHVTDPLKAAIERGRINHAYLFSGPRGCGKTTSARILARCLNCEKGPTPVPCGECPSCRDLANGGPGSLDVVEIDAASHNGVDDARDLRERAVYAPARDRFKVFILDEAHMVTSQGFNALLKIVEEPPPHIKFIFATTEPEKVIGTIRSRTHHYPFRLVPPEALGNYLDELCRRENVQVAKGVLPLVVRAGGGSVRDTLSVLDQLIAGSGPNGVDYATAIALLGYTPDSLLSDIVDAFSAGDGGGVYRAVERVIESGQDPRRFVEDLLERMRDLIVIHAAPEAAHAFLPEVPPDRLERLTLQARGFGQAELSRAADLLNQGLTEMSGATSPRLQLELICARILLPGSGRGRDAVLSRVERMERRIGMSPTGVTTSVPAVASGTDSAEPASGGSDSGGSQQTQPQSSPAAQGAAQQPPTAQGGPSTDDIDELTAMAAAAESMLQEPTQPPAARQTQSPEAREEPRHQQQAQSQPQQSPPQPRPAEQAPQPQSRPAPQPPQSSQVASQAPSQSAGDDHSQQAGPAGPGAGGVGGEIEAIRRAWPSILAAVEKRSRLTRAIIAANAIPQTFTNGVLYLGFNNAGSVQGFQQRDHAAKLALAINDVLGIQAGIDIGDVGRLTGSSGQGEFGGGGHSVSGSPNTAPDDFIGNRGPESNSRRPSPQEIAAVVGPREVDKPQVDHEKFWETNDSAQGPWSTDDEEGEPAGEQPSPQATPDSRSAQASPGRDADGESSAESSRPATDPDDRSASAAGNHAEAADSHTDSVPDFGPAGVMSQHEAASDEHDSVGDERDVTDLDEPEIVVPDLSDDDFIAPSEYSSSAETGRSMSGRAADTDRSTFAARRGDADQDFETPVEYVQPRWEEPAWNDAPQSPGPSDPTSAGAGAVEVGALVVPPPEDDDLDYLGAYGDPDVDFMAEGESPTGSGPAGSNGHANHNGPGRDVPSSPQSAPTPATPANGKAFTSRFAAIAQRYGAEAPEPPPQSYGNEHSSMGAASVATADRTQTPATGSDEDEYDPETDLDVSEAPQMGVAVIARVLGGEIIDEREV